MMNAVDPIFNMAIFNGAKAGGADYLDMAMSLSRRHPDKPYELTGVKLGDEQFAVADRVGSRRAGSRCAASGSSPGCPTSSHGTPPITSSPRSTSSAPVTAPTSRSPTMRATRSSRRRSRCGPRSRSASTRPSSGRRTVAGSPPRRSRSRRSSTSPRASGRSSASTSSTKRCSSCPAGSTASGPRSSTASATSSSTSSRSLNTLGLDRTEKVRVKGVEVSPRDVVAAVLPDPATVGTADDGQDVRGPLGHRHRQRRQAASTYLYHVVDNETTMREYGHQCVVWQTAINPVVALELLARGTWSGAGVLGPEAFDAVPFLDLLTDYGSPWGQKELDLGLASCASAGSDRASGDLFDRPARGSRRLSGEPGDRRAGGEEQAHDRPQPGRRRWSRSGTDEVAARAPRAGTDNGTKVISPRLVNDDTRPIWLGSMARRKAPTAIPTSIQRRRRRPSSRRSTTGSDPTPTRATAAPSTTRTRKPATRRVLRLPPDAGQAADDGARCQRRVGDADPGCAPPGPAHIQGETERDDRSDEHVQSASCSITKMRATGVART